MTTLPYPLRIDKRIMPLVELKAREEYTDKSTALRKLLYQGIEDYVLELYQQGRLSIGKAAEMLNKTIYEAHQLIQKHNIKIEHAEHIYAKSKGTTERLFKK